MCGTIPLRVWNHVEDLWRHGKKPRDVGYMCRRVVVHVSCRPVVVRVPSCRRPCRGTGAEMYLCGRHIMKSQEHMYKLCTEENITIYVVIGPASKEINQTTVHKKETLNHSLEWKL